MIERCIAMEKSRNENQLLNRCIPITEKQAASYKRCDSLGNDFDPSDFSSSPKFMPPASNEFSNILYKLKTTTTDDKKNQSPKSKSKNLNGILVCKKPRKSKNFITSSKTKRKVHFDETTITTTAEFGETAAMYRSRSLQKRMMNKRKVEGNNRHTNDLTIDIVSYEDVLNDKVSKHSSIFDTSCVFSYSGKFI